MRRYLGALVDTLLVAWAMLVLMSFAYGGWSLSRLLG